jgi:hypothetical protein
MGTHEDSKHEVDDNISTKLWKSQPTYRDDSLLFASHKFRRLYCHFIQIVWVALRYLLLDKSSWLCCLVPLCLFHLLRTGYFYPNMANGRNLEW